MALDDYAKKRAFDKTPEPAPFTPPPTGARRFCVQRHHARRLHYDLRIEIGGTLKSWAVPQGPTLDPAIKRLAVHVEDHPLEYATFEGNIPKGNYGAGSMMLWDTGTYELLGGKSDDDQLARGDFKFRLHGRKLRGEFALVRLKNSAKGNDWLLIKKKDDAAQPGWDIDGFAYSVLTGRTQQEIALDAPAKTTGVKAEMPAKVEPMLAQIADAPPAGPDWIYEIKWDGVRALCYLQQGELRVRSRKGLPMDRQYPELAGVKDAVDAESAILDGEVVALDDNGRPNFHRLQPRIMATDAGAVQNLARTRPVLYYVFDLLYLNGNDLRGLPFEERKRLLASILRPSPAVRISEHFQVPGDQLLDLVRAQGLEGIVAKRLSSKYTGARSPEWLKLKIVHEQDFVICGYMLGEREFFASLVLGVWEQDHWEFVGGVGTGFDRKLLESIHRLLGGRETPQCPFPRVPQLLHPARWVRPELVCTVKYANWTGDGRLRAPVFIGLRTDVEPQECVRTPSSGLERRPPLIDHTKDEATIRADGQSFRTKNLNKIFYPRERYTKRDLLNYYDAVADFLLPHWRDRPLSLRRYPDGIEGEGFFQKNAEGLPDWIRRATLDEDGEPKVRVVGDNRAQLLYLANLGCIDQNIWMSRVGSLDHPDFILIDLDPAGCPYDRIVEAALVVRRKLDALGLEGYPKTTGGDGMHVYIPVAPVYVYGQTRAFAEILARLVAAQRPDLFTLPRTVARREKGKVYFDYIQNSRGKTISGPYVPRAHPGAAVATPLEWREIVPGLHPSQFHIKNAPDRFYRLGDLFEGVLSNPQRLEPAMEKLDTLVRGASG